MKISAVRLVVAASAAAGLAACSGASNTSPRMPAEWMHTLYGAIRVERVSPPVASRLLAYAATALYSGLAAANPEMRPLDGILNGLDSLPRPEPGSRYDGTLTAVAAERVVLDSLLRQGLPTTRASVARLADSLRKARIAAGVSEDVRSRSEELGRRIGLALVAWSRADGFDGTRGRSYVAPIGPGLWVNDAPASTYAAQNLSGASDFVALDNPANILRAGNTSDRALIINRPKQAGLATLPPVNMAGMAEPYWGEIRPFVLRSWDECAVPPAPPYSSEPGSEFHEDARQVHATRLSLTPEQRSIAFYWADNPGESGTPPGHWIAIATQMVSQRGLSAEDAARAMLLTALAQADAFIASWGFKYQLNGVRPRGYIRSVIDSTWEPLIPNPPFPEYPSGHSTQSAAAGAALTAFLGDGIAFDDSTSLSIGHPVRRFASFTAAAEEAGLSRVYGGIHFQFANSAGQAVGRCIGAKAVERLRFPAKQ